MSFIKRLNELLKLHFNLPKTIYFNLSVFGIKDALRLPVFLFGKIQLEGLHRGCIELLHFRTGGVRIGGGRFTELYGYSNREKSYLRIKGKMILGNDVIMQQGIVLSICENATLRIGNNVIFNERATIHSKHDISIGDKCRFGWNTQILDSGFHYMINKGKIAYRNAPIVLGHNVWVANGVSIMKGTYLPAFTVVASNSLVNKNFREIGEHCLIGGIPAKYITNGVERLLIRDSEVDKLFSGPGEVIMYDAVETEFEKAKYQKQ